MSGIYEYIDKTVEILTNPAKADKSKAALALTWTEIDKKTNNKVELSVNLFQLLAMANLSEEKMIAAEIELTVALQYRDFTSFLFTCSYLAGSPGIQGLARRQLIDLVKAQSQKISNTTQMSRFRRLIMGRGGRKEGEMVEDGASVSPE